MLNFEGIAVRRDGFKFVVAGVPESWYDGVRWLGWVRVLFELSLAVLGITATFVGVRFSAPYLTFMLSALIFIELGRPDIEYKYETKYTTPKMSITDSNQDSSENRNSIQLDFDPPLVVINHFYLDADGDRIPKDEVGLHGSEEVEIHIPPGHLESLGEKIAEVSVPLPYPVRNVIIKQEPEEEYQNRLPDG